MISFIYLIYLEEHQEHLRLVLEVMREKQIYTKLSKNELWLDEFTFLRHAISTKGIFVDPSKVESVLQWECPRTVTNIRSYVGLVNYYRRFIEDFSKDPSEPFEVSCDVSLRGPGCVLMQNKRVVTYALRQLKVHEKNYPTHDLKLATMMFALKTRRHYLYGAKFNIFSDHKNLKYLYDRSWMEFFDDYEFQLMYHLRKVNVVTNALNLKFIHMFGLMVKELKLVEKFRDLNLNVELT
uniref:Retrovirus-related Pol polyprotein from transposon 17.6 n=1 Tax=Cajanus cajan TaxID=3821 RepID=A0A151SMJ8_CAJCA|nr:Retrovirus-related Pol polyprotein from transposon 17.6 [Cajanus cajan]